MHLAYYLFLQDLRFSLCLETNLGNPEFATYALIYTSTVPPKLRNRCLPFPARIPDH